MARPRHSNAPPYEEFEDPIWEQQSLESARWYQCFLIYADLPPGQRTYAEGWRRWQEINGHKANNEPSDSYILNARSWHWKERALARDRDKIEAAKQSWLDLDLARRKHDFDLGQKLRDLAGDRLQEIDSENLKEELTPMQAAKIAMMASRLQEAALSGLRPQKGQVRELLDAMPAQLRQQVVPLLIARIEKKD